MRRSRGDMMTAWTKELAARTEKCRWVRKYVKRKTNGI